MRPMLKSIASGTVVLWGINEKTKMTKLNANDQSLLHLLQNWYIFKFESKINYKGPLCTKPSTSSFHLY